jgi:hypothetical protein
MAETIRLHLEVEGDIIIVTLPGTTFRVNCSKPKKSPGLVAFGVHSDKDAGVPQSDFLARPWRVANDKARELGVDNMRPPLDRGSGAASGMGGSASWARHRETAPAIGL